MCYNIFVKILAVIQSCICRIFSKYILNKYVVLPVNLHYWHWHLIYPGDGPREIVAKDRRGELFYYMHNQVIARYNVERICNGLSRVKSLKNFREPIPEGYFSKVTRSSNNRTYAARNTNALLHDLNRPEDNVFYELADMERWYTRILHAIDEGYVIDKETKEKIPLDEVKGIDILGDIVESTILTPNDNLYGHLHAVGHDFIGFSHDPDGWYLEEYGVMGDVATALRDPIFYRWHSFIDDIFVKFKDTLKPYDYQQLSYDGIEVTKVDVQGKRSKTPNLLRTYWQESDIDMSTSLDFQSAKNGTVYAKVRSSFSIYRQTDKF